MDRATGSERRLVVGRLEPREMSGFAYGSHPTGPPYPSDRTPSPLRSKSNFLSV